MLILIRINAIYGWSRTISALTLFLFCAESVIGITTTVVSILGGSKTLVESTGILNCMPNQVNVPDINASRKITSMLVACIYLGLILHQATDAVDVIEVTDEPTTCRRMPILAAFRYSRTIPTFHRCLRDAGIYFIVIFGVLLLNLVLILKHNPYAQLGTPWLLATYSVASTRIFLNLKDLSLERELHNAVTWSEFERNSGLDLQVPSDIDVSDQSQPAHTVVQAGMGSILLA
ncbi:hypothetical protein B0H11DRAFT_2195534 [Mycena galericulata]|nr:hypothetical protein B0H11DRAFT_2195534 [Mycena galericulata]